MSQYARESIMSPLSYCILHSCRFKDLLHLSPNIGPILMVLNGTYESATPVSAK